ncbi:MAG: coproporphyrinogen III oxidase [Planctomycetaceae bacterium]|nr:coproporphyrinogen III oxidase [Planctomycetaceae bacterium]
MLDCLAEPKAVYIHVPFCRHRCGYCDFTLVARKDHLIDAYLDAMESELASLGETRYVETIFIGGGTPTHLAPQQLERLLALINHWFESSPDCEFSCEANPLDMTSERLAILRDAGVNRLSLGIQSFDDRALEILERDHRANDLSSILQRVGQTFDNVSLDLIFGVPGQTLGSWQQTLQSTIDARPRHVSTYGLTFEKGTSFWSRRNRGELQQMEDALEADMYMVSIQMLAEAGIHQYEISNFAQAGFECRHNEVYWRGLPYFGFGPGAARYTNGWRDTNHRSVTSWLKLIESKESAIATTEELSPEDRAREAIVLGLRRTCGVDRREFSRLTGYELDELASSVITSLVEAGHLEDQQDAIRLTDQGRMLFDSVILEFL